MFILINKYKLIWSKITKITHLPRTFLGAGDQLSAWILQLRCVEEHLRVPGRKGNAVELRAAEVSMPAAGWSRWTWSGPDAAARVRFSRPVNCQGLLLPAGRAARSGWRKPAASRLVSWFPRCLYRVRSPLTHQETEADCDFWLKI